MTVMPGAVDTLVNPDAGLGDQLNTATKEHDDQHANANDAIEATERIVVGPTWFNERGYPQATFDARFAAALADAHSGGGTVVVAPITTNTAGLGTITKPTVSVKCPGGSAATKLTYTGTGDGLLISPSPFTVVQMGKLEGFTLFGTAAAGARGIRHYDAGTLMAMDDVVIENFTGAGAVGCCIENGAFWNERANGNRVHLNHNTIGMQLIGTGAANSFAYHRWLDLRLNLGLSQIGIQFKGTALAYSGLWNIICNADANDGILFDFLDSASISGHVFVTGEQTTGTGMIFRQMAAGSTWGAHVYRNVFGAVGGSFPQMPDAGTLNRILSPYEINRDGRIVNLWPSLPTGVAAAGAGSSPPAPVVTGNDQSAVVLTGTGTGAAFGDQAVITFYEPHTVIPNVSVSPFGRPTALLLPYLAAVTTDDYTIGFANAPADSQPAGTYGVIVRVG